MGQRTHPPQRTNYDILLLCAIGLAIAIVFMVVSQ